MHWSLAGAGRRVVGGRGCLHQRRRGGGGPVGRSAGRSAVVAGPSASQPPVRRPLLRRLSAFSTEQGKVMEEREEKS